MTRLGNATRVGDHKLIGSFDHGSVELYVLRQEVDAAMPERLR